MLDTTQSLSSNYKPMTAVASSLVIGILDLIRPLSFVIWISPIVRFWILTLGPGHCAGRLPGVSGVNGHIEQRRFALDEVELRGQDNHGCEPVAARLETGYLDSGGNVSWFELVQLT